jgi:hypothetical protein
VEGIAEAETGTSGAPRLNAAEMSALSWLSEQYAARVDQLAQWVRRSPRSAQRYLQRLGTLDLTRARPLLHGAPAWAWVTDRGARLAGGGYRAWTPRFGRLAHVAAVNEVRLRLRDEEPEAVWICERALARSLEPGEPRPDALLLSGERELAVEVELIPKAASRLAARLDGLARCYDGAIYYCAPSTLKQLDAMRESGRWPRLEVRALPNREKGRLSRQR